MSVRRPHRASPARSSDWPRLWGATLAYTAAGALTARSGALALISRRRIRVEAILENIGQISVSVVTKHCQPPVTPSLGGDARVPRPGSRAWLPSSCAPLARRPGGSAGSASRGRGGPCASTFWECGGGGGVSGAADGLRGPRTAALPAATPLPSPRLQRGGTGTMRSLVPPPVKPGPQIPLSTPPGLTAAGRRAEASAPLFGVGAKGERLSSDACGVGSSALGGWPRRAQRRVPSLGGAAARALGSRRPGSALGDAGCGAVRGGAVTRRGPGPGRGGGRPRKAGERAKETTQPFRCGGRAFEIRGSASAAGRAPLGRVAVAARGRARGGGAGVMCTVSGRRIPRGT